MKKLKLLGIEKSEHHCRFIFSKDQEFVPAVRKFLLELEFNPGEVEELLHPEETVRYRAHGKVHKTTAVDHSQDMKVKSLTDNRFNLQTDVYCVDIIFGKGKIFLLIHTKTDKQKEVSKALRHFIKE